MAPLIECQKQSSKFIYLQFHTRIHTHMSGNTNSHEYVEICRHEAMTSERFTDSAQTKTHTCSKLAWLDQVHTWAYIYTHTYKTNCTLHEAPNYCAHTNANLQSHKHWMAVTLKLPVCSPSSRCWCCWSTHCCIVVVAAVLTFVIAHVTSLKWGNYKSWINGSLLGDVVPTADDFVVARAVVVVVPYLSTALLHLRRGAIVGGQHR